jgi:hypothetical protein
MSATNFTPIQLYRTSTAAAVPTAGNLAAGELAINLTDEALYFKNAAGVVKLLADSSGALGSVTSVDVSGGTTGLTTSGGPITSSGTITLAGTLGVANGGTGTATAFTAGSVVFAGASGVYSQDNANLFWDNANDRLGIGTASPAQRLDVTGSANSVQARFGNTAGRGLTIGTAVVSGTNDAGVVFNAPTTEGTFIFQTVSTERMRITTGGSLLIGTSIPFTTGGNAQWARFQIVGNNFSGAGGAVISLGRGEAATAITAGEELGLISFSDNAGGTFASISSEADGTAGTNDYPGRLLFSTTADGASGQTERMRITSSGAVGVGVTPATWSDFKVLQFGDVGAIYSNNFGSGNTQTIFSNGVYHNSGYKYLQSGSAVAQYTQIGAEHRWFVAPTGTAGDAVSFTQAMTLSAGGGLGIGVSSPAERLDVAGNAKISSGSSFYWGDATSQITASNAGPMRFLVGNGGEKMRIDAAGAVGIGTSSPGAQLHVATPASGAGVIFRYTGGSNNPGLFISTTEATSVCEINATGSTGNNNLAIAISGTERMRVNSDGNVGIGTSSVAGGRVQINGATSDTDGLGLDQGQLLITDSDAAAANGMMLGYRFQAGITEYGRIQCRNAIGATNLILQAGGGNVGIGTAAPQAPFGGRALQVGTTTDARAVFTLQSTTSGLGSIYFSDGTTGGDTFVGYIDYDHSGNRMSFGTGATERMRIDSSGNLLVGTTSVSDLSTGAASNPGFGVASGQVRSQWNADANAYWSKVNVSSSTVLHDFYVAGTRVGVITTNGSTTTYGTSSDARLKENIADADDAANLIDAIQVRKFDWKADNSHQRYGFVAQELLEVAPEAVTNLLDPDEMMGVDYSKLVPMLIKEIQSLRARVAQLEGN